MHARGGAPPAGLKIKRNIGGLIVSFCVYSSEDMHSIKQWRMF